MLILAGVVLCLLMLAVFGTLCARVDREDNARLAAQRTAERHRRYAPDGDGLELQFEAACLALEHSERAEGALI
ncbi:MAG: hypothetical protein AAB417_03985 [Patescibacteria group bacterium]